MPRAKSRGVTPPIADAIDDLIRKPKLVDDILRLEFPGSHAPPPPPNSGSAKDQFAAKRHKQIGRRCAELQQMTVKELAALESALAADALEQDARLREKQTPPSTKPDAKFWRREELWSLVDAVLLHPANLEPQRDLGLHIKEILAADVGTASRMTSRLSDDAQSHLNNVRTALRLASDAASLGRLTVRDGKVEPRQYLQWAREKEFEPRAWLQPLVAAHDKQSALPKGIARKTLEELQRAVDKLKAARRPVSQKAVIGHTKRARSTVQAYWTHLKR